MNSTAHRVATFICLGHGEKHLSSLLGNELGKISFVTVCR